jgi:hypothetical protein
VESLCEILSMLERTFSITSLILVSTHETSISQSRCFSLIFTSVEGGVDGSLIEDLAASLFLLIYSAQEYIEQDEHVEQH